MGQDIDGKEEVGGAETLVCWKGAYEGSNRGDNVLLLL